MEQSKGVGQYEGFGGFPPNFEMYCTCILIAKVWNLRHTSHALPLSSTHTSISRASRMHRPDCAYPSYHVHKFVITPLKEYTCNIAPFTHSLLNRFANRFILNHVSPFTRKLLPEVIQSTCKHVKSIWEPVYVNHLATWFEAGLA